jgi:hypothetical protein
VASMHDAGAVPTASPPRQVGHGAVAWAVWRRNDCTAAKAKIPVSGVAERPVAGSGGKRADLFDDGGGRTWVDEGRLSWAVRRGGLFFQRRRSTHGSGRLFFGAPVGPGRDGDGDFFDLADRNRSDGHEAAHKGDGARDGARAILPAPNAPRADSEYPGGAARRETKRAECRAELSCGRGALVSPPERYSPPFWGVRVDGDRHCGVPDFDLNLDLNQVAPGPRCDRIN